MNATFFGHKYITEKIDTKLKNIIILLIEKYNVTTFYVGNHGEFDLLVIKTLIKLKNEYPYIQYFIVLAYIPNKSFNIIPLENTILPDAIETVPKKFAIIKRNEWMISKSNYVICYVNNKFGNSYKFMKMAKNSGKEIINLATTE